MFYPVEDQLGLTRLRSLISPFMTKIQQCFSTTSLNRRQKEEICDNVINSVSSFVDQEFLNELNQIIVKRENRTLGLEHDALRQFSIR